MTPDAGAVAERLREQGVDVVLCGHLGQGMLRMLESMGIRVHTATGGVSALLASLELAGG